jgi:hypothetical protein
VGNTFVTRCNGTDPSGIANSQRPSWCAPLAYLRINDTTSYCGTLDQTKFLGSLLAQTLSDRLTGSENKTVLSWDTTQLIKVVGDHILQSCLLDPIPSG